MKFGIVYLYQKNYLLTPLFDINMKENMTFSWKIRSKLSSFYIYKISKHFVKFEMIINILFNFQNPFQTLKTIKAGQYPLRLTKKNKTFEIKNKFELSLILKNLDQKITFEDGYMIIKNNSKKLKFKHYETIELDIFLQDYYSKLPVKNKILIDVGGNVGDSSLLYSSLGAKKVIMLEPQPKFFEFAIENIKSNEYSNIQLINAGLSNASGYFKINYEKSDKTFAFQEDDIHGIQIPKTTLEEIISKIPDSNLVLKLDCEGCEYEVLLDSLDDVLKKFDYILLEFHSGFQNISNRLKNLGFNVTILNSKYTPKKQYRGHLLASK